jgi:hypothetical protein
VSRGPDNPPSGGVEKRDRDHGEDCGSPTTNVEICRWHGRQSIRRFTRQWAEFAVEPKPKRIDGSPAKIAVFSGSDGSHAQNRFTSASAEFNRGVEITHVANRFTSASAERMRIGFSNSGATGVDASELGGPGECQGRPHA